MAEHNREHHETYIIPPNFIDTGTIFGGMFRLRNAIEAVGAGLLFGVPVFYTPFSLTTKIIIMCLTALPLALLALIGISGESLSSFVLNFFRFLRNRRVIKRSDQPRDEENVKKYGKKRPAKKSKPPKKKKRRRRRKKKRGGKPVEHTPKKYCTDFKDEFGNERLENKRAQRDVDRAAHKKEDSEKQKRFKMVPLTSDRPSYNPYKAATLEEYVPVESISRGMIHTKDGRYLRILEIEPINFLLRSAREQKGIVYSFISYLKISPVKLHIKVVTRKADINKHLDLVYEQMARETDERCKALQADYIELIRSIGMREAITRRFFLIIEYEPLIGTRHSGPDEAYSMLESTTQTARNYFQQCGNKIIEHENENEFQTEVLYTIFNRKSSVSKRLQTRISEVASRYMSSGENLDLDKIPISEFIAPESIDFTNGHYVKMDGLYHAYLIIPGDGYKSHVNAGWLALLVNAGEGIDVDLHISRQPKERIIPKLGQQLRINRSKIKETSDTNTDFDDLESAISSGYYLKNGLANNQDFYFINIMITVTAESPDELEWRVSEMKKLMLSQDLQAMPCTFRNEQALQSAMPLASIDKVLYEKSKRNILSSGVGSCYPFVSYEVSDDNGILMGVNRHNNSMVIADLFNTETYKNANVGLLGTSGAGKTFLMQLMATRLRRKNIQVFIVAPHKGHEFKRCCDNIGGTFIPIGPGINTCINFFEIRKTDTTATELLDGDNIEKSKLADKIQTLHIGFSLLIPDMNYEEKQFLDEALIKTYAQKGITHDNESLWDPNNSGEYREMPIMGDLYNILMKDPSTKRMANIINRFVNGSAKSFNQQTNVDLTNKYIVLDVSGCHGDMLVFANFLALDLVVSKVQEDRTQEKAIMLDEVWQLIGASSNPLASERVLSVAKTVRAYGASAWFATQDLNDFFALEDGKYGKGILNNCKIKIVLNLEDEEAMRVEQVLKLSETEVLNITRFERGSGLIIANSNNVQVDFKASQLETELITTDRIQLQQLLKKKRDKKDTK